uniref:Uncharacterized protein n=1 Tax=Anguilla anguilla TaxID=7936 RepID=A0A0E9XI86_ANGAN
MGANENWTIESSGSVLTVDRDSRCC